MHVYPFDVFIHALWFIDTLIEYFEWKIRRQNNSYNDNTIEKKTKLKLFVVTWLKISWWIRWIRNQWIRWKSGTIIAKIHGNWWISWKWIHQGGKTTWIRWHLVHVSTDLWPVRPWITLSGTPASNKALTPATRRLWFVFFSLYSCFFAHRWNHFVKHIPTNRNSRVPWFAVIKGSRL